MQLDSRQIAQILPQAYPFLMIDRVVEFKKGESLTAVKNITGSEWVFDSLPAPQSYLSNTFPETLIIEAAAQAVILFQSLNSERSPSGAARVFLGQAKADFAKPVHIGDQLTLKTSSGRALKTGGYMDVEVAVGKDKVADVQIFYSLK